MPHSPAVRRLARYIGPESMADWPDGYSGMLREALARLVEPLEVAVVAPRRPVRRPPLHVVSVYRARNAWRLGAVLEQSHPDDVALWALDQPVAELSQWTMGSGPGLRFALLNALIERLEASPEAAWLAVVDDDVRFVRGDLRTAVGLAADAGLDLAQPSHSRWSNLNWSSTRHHLFSTARLCRYVEQGPVALLSPKGRQDLTPFPEDIGMGWGVEARWAMRQNLRLGVVDAVTMAHEQAVSRAGSYDIDEAWAQALRLLTEAGYKDYAQLQRTEASWRPWQSRPPWLGHTGTQLSRWP